MSDPQDNESIAPQRVLVIDDESVIGMSIKRCLGPAGHEVVCCEDPRLGLETATTGSFDVIFLDLMMPGLDGLEVLRRIKNEDIMSEVVIITGHSTVESAVEAMRRGAADYLAKPFTPDELRMTLRKVAERCALIRENAALREELEMQRGFEGIIGESAVMQRVFSLVKRVAPTDGTVLISGESGTGKEVIAKAIHRLSRRAGHPLLACDCSALAASLLESELFGHVKGAFTGAYTGKQGLFEVADKGTLFLDEVANLSTETQSKLLRVLETRRVRRVGETSEREIDIRLITASNRDLATMVEDGTFRQDLYYRLNVVPLKLPPLRDRAGDIPLLSIAFLERVCRKNNLTVTGFTSDAMRLMESYSWPGNVRELRNIVERVAILCDGRCIEPHHLPAEILTALQKPAIALPQQWEQFKELKQHIRDSAVQEIEHRFLEEALKRASGNVSKAAEDVGMQRTHFHALMRKYGLSTETH